MNQPAFYLNYIRLYSLNVLTAGAAYIYENFMFSGLDRQTNEIQ